MQEYTLGPKSIKLVLELILMSGIDLRELAFQLIPFQCLPLLASADTSAPIRVHNTITALEKVVQSLQSFEANLFNADFWIEAEDSETSCTIPLESIRRLLLSMTELRALRIGCLTDSCEIPNAWYETFKDLRWDHLYDVQLGGLCRWEGIRRTHEEGDEDVLSAGATKALLTFLHSHSKTLRILHLRGMPASVNFQDKKGLTSYKALLTDIREQLQLETFQLLVGFDHCACPVYDCDSALCEVPSSYEPFEALPILQLEYFVLGKIEWPFKHDEPQAADDAFEGLRWHFIDENEDRYWHRPITQ